MNRIETRILTTHVGSLPRPVELLDLMKARLSGAPHDEAAYDSRVRSAVADVVVRKIDSGIDIVADGEMSKAGFFGYVRERLAGFEPRPGEGPKVFAREREAFPEYYEEYFKRAMLRGAVAPMADILRGASEQPRSSRASQGYR